MYEFKKNIYLNCNDYYEEWSFGISLQSNTQFEFLDCYYTFYRGNLGHEEEMLSVSYYNNDNHKNIAEKKIEMSLKTLTYLFLIPLYTDSFTKENEVRNIPKQIRSGSKIKVDKLEKISNRIKKFKKTRQLFDEVILIFNAGIKFSCMNNFMEDSFLNYFKIVEKICKFDYEIRKDEIRKELNTVENQGQLRLYLNKFLCENFHIEYSSNKIDDLTGNVTGVFLKNIQQDVFSKVMIYCKKNDILINADRLGKTINIRNMIAHGEIVDIKNYLKEFSYINHICLNIISKKFFDSKYDDIRIECKVDI